MSKWNGQYLLRHDYCVSYCPMQSDWLNDYMITCGDWTMMGGVNYLDKIL